MFADGTAKSLPIVPRAGTRTPSSPGDQPIAKILRAPGDWVVTDRQRPAFDTEDYAAEIVDQARHRRRISPMRCRRPHRDEDRRGVRSTTRLGLSARARKVFRLRPRLIQRIGRNPSRATVRLLPRARADRRMPAIGGGAPGRYSTATVVRSEAAGSARRRDRQHAERQGVRRARVRPSRMAVDLGEEEVVVPGGPTDARHGDPPLGRAGG